MLPWEMKPDEHWSGWQAEERHGSCSRIRLLSSSLAVTNWKHHRYVREKQPEVGMGDGAASETALRLQGWKRSCDSWGRSRPASKQPGQETPRWINNPDIWWNPGIAAISEVLAPARISLVISSVQPVWGGCSLRKAAGTGLWIDLNLCEAKNKLS